MAAPTEVGSLFGKLELDDSKFKKGLETARSGLAGVGSSISDVGRGVSRFGRQLTLFTAPLLLGLGAAGAMAVNFSQSMTNAGAILGMTAEETAGLREEILAIGAASTMGPQAAADAFFTIVSGVQDATTHMDILTSSIALAEAGQADLAVTTEGLVAVMNAYGFAAEEASFVSDVFARTVQKGVGTMDEFVGALNPIASLANTVGISFEELGGATAFLTAQGVSASTAAVQLAGIMNAFLKPNAAMTEAIAAMGFSSGLAALETLGLQGAVEALNTATGGLEGTLASALGTQEALRGSTALLKEEAPGFMDEYMAGLEGATEAARAIQAEDPAFVFAQLKSQAQGAAIQIGTAMLPALQALAEDLIPIVRRISDWISANPKLVTQMLKITGVLIALGPILSVVGQGINTMGLSVSFLLSPLGLMTAAIAGIILFLDHLGQLEPFKEMLQEIQAGILPALQQLGAWFMAEGLPAIIAFVQGTVIPALQNFVTFLAGVWAVVGPALQQLGAWFIAEGLPAIIAFVQGTVIPALQNFVTFLAGVWAVVGPALQQLGAWFIAEALPAIVAFIQGTVIPIISRLTTIIMRIWDAVGPQLMRLADWFITDILPAIVEFIGTTVIPIIEFLAETIGMIWEIVGPPLEKLGEWFLDVGLPLIVDFITGPFGAAFTGMLDLLSTIWTVVKPSLTLLRDGFILILDLIISGIETLVGWIGDLIGWIADIDLGILEDAAGLIGDVVGGILGAGGDVADFLGFAEGGRPPVGVPSLVGEEGPEFFVPDTAGTIIPNDQLGGMMGGGISFDGAVFHIVANSEEEGRAAARGWKAEMTEALAAVG